MLHSVGIMEEVLGSLLNESATLVDTVKRVDYHISRREDCKWEILFKGLASEVDAVPSKEIEALWDAEQFRTKREAAESYLSQYRDEIVIAIRDLVDEERAGGTQYG